MVEALGQEGRKLVSVLNREPMGMKHKRGAGRWGVVLGFSAQPRADGDEARMMP